MINGNDLMKHFQIPNFILGVDQEIFTCLKSKNKAIVCAARQRATTDADVMCVGVLCSFLLTELSTHQRLGVLSPLSLQLLCEMLHS